MRTSYTTQHGVLLPLQKTIPEQQPSGRQPWMPFLPHAGFGIPSDLSVMTPAEGISLCCVLIALPTCRLYSRGAADGEAHLSWLVYHESAGQNPGGYRYCPHSGIVAEVLACPHKDGLLYHERAVSCPPTMLSLCCTYFNTMTLI